MWHHVSAYAEHYHHPYYASHAVADHGGWLMHTIVGGVIHGLIYGVIFRLFRGMSMGEAWLSRWQGLHWWPPATGFGIAAERLRTLNLIGTWCRSDIYRHAHI